MTVQALPMDSPLSAFLQQSPLQLAQLLHCSQQPSLVAEAHILVDHLPGSLWQETQELLPWLSESALVLVLAHCATRRGRGGPAAKPDPLQDSNKDMTAAARKAANRQAAALSKLRTKLGKTAGQLLSNEPAPSAAARARPLKLRLNASLLAINTQPMKRPAEMPPLSLSGSSSSSSSSSSFTTPWQQQAQHMPPCLSLDSGIASPAAAAAAAQNGAVFAGGVTGGTSQASLNLQQQLLGSPQPIDFCVNGQPAPPAVEDAVVPPDSAAAPAAQLLDTMLQQAPAAAGSAADDGENLDFGALCEFLGITD